LSKEEPSIRSVSNASQIRGDRRASHRESERHVRHKNRRVAPARRKELPPVACGVRLRIARMIVREGAVLTSRQSIPLSASHDHVNLPIGVEDLGSVHQFIRFMLLPMIVATNNQGSRGAFKYTPNGVISGTIRGVSTWTFM
jgi:hypothetical protein